MTGAFKAPYHSQRTQRPLLWALGVSVFLHLLTGGVWGGLKRWVDESPDTAPDWVRTLVLQTEVVLTPSTPTNEIAWKEINLEFIEVDPNNAAEKDTLDSRFYSSANTVAAQPIPLEKKLPAPQITGVQTTTPKTFDTVKSAQPQQEEKPSPTEKTVSKETPVPTKTQEAKKPQPVGGPKELGETQIALIKPAAQVEKVQEEQRPAEEQIATNPRPKPIRKLAEAREQKGIILGEKMLQMGGVSRLSLSPSFDVRRSPFGEYDLRMIASIQERWWLLLEERHYSLERTGKVVIYFLLKGDGTISGVRTLNSDVGESLSFTCEAAILGSSPFGRWPPVLKSQSSDPREITITFNYN
ncbi:MAG: hypothetical protein EXS25_08605 [Pedosphaera sp.]|nr:hypothetical protein [Pedosphaera sp.]